MSNLATNLLNAESEVRKIRREINAAIEAATTDIRAAFSDKFATAKKIVSDLELAIADCAIANATHPLLGKKVTRVKREHHGYHRHTDKQIFGLCEVFTNATPRRPGWCRHSPGEIVARVLKKDGKPGATIENINEWSEYNGI